MSEPYTLVISLPITALALRQALGQVSQPATAFDDWGLLGFDVEPVHLERAAASRGWTPRRYLAEMRDYGRDELGWMFRHDMSTGRLTCVVLLWAENLGEVIGGLAVLRGLVAASDWLPADPAHILVHDYVFDTRGTLGAVVGGNGVAQIVAGTSPLVAPLVAGASGLVRGMIEQADDAENGNLTADPATLIVDHFPDWG